MKIVVFFSFERKKNMIARVSYKYELVLGLFYNESVIDRRSGIPFPSYMYVVTSRRDAVEKKLL